MPRGFKRFFALLFSILFLISGPLSFGGPAFFRNPTPCAGNVTSGCSYSAVASGQSSGACDAGFTGACSFKCFRGVWTAISNTCEANCAAQTVNWTVGGDTCTANAPALNGGQSLTLTDSTGPETGTADITCDNGTITEVDSTCDVITAGSQTYSTAGTFTFVVPAHNTLTVKVWGGGGGGGAYQSGYVNGTAGGVSKWNNTVIANGGARATGRTGGAGGTASGGTTNTSGATGETGVEGSYGGKGGNGASGGAGGARNTTNSTAGKNGSAPGGAGGGSFPGARAGGGGGGGGYSTITYSAGTLTPGSSITVVVGAAGTGASATYKGGNGAVGRVAITWD